MAKTINSAVHVSWPKPDFNDIVISNKNFKRNFNAALMYVHYEISAKDLKKELTKYLKLHHADSNLLNRTKDMNENRLFTIGKYMYLRNRGCDLPEEIENNIISALEKIVSEEERKKATQEKEDKVFEEPKIAINIQDRIKDRANEAANEIEGWIDDFLMNKKSEIKSTEDFVNLFKANELKSQHTSYIENMYAKQASEIELALSGNDKELLESYSFFTKAELKKYDNMYKNLFKACSMMQETAKANRAPPKKKAPSVEKIISKIKYKKEDSTLGIASINPTKIIGSKEVWCFDTKTRKLIKYVADELSMTLTIKGSTILGIDTTKSISKTLRKPNEQLAEFKKCTKVQLRTFIDGINTLSITPSGKLNENCIILKAS